MVKTAELRYGDNASEFNWLHRPWLRRVFAQREVRSGFVIVASEQLHVPVERGLVEHNDMIETLAPKRANDPFDIGSLPRRSRSRKDLLDSHRFHLRDEIKPEDIVAVAQQITGGRVPRKCFSQLLRGPFCRRMRSYTEMNDAPPVMCQDQEDIQDLGTGE